MPLIGNGIDFAFPPVMVIDKMQTDVLDHRIFASFPGEEVMANISSEHAPVREWGRRIAFWSFGAVSTTLILIAIFLAFLIVSGVIEW